MVNKSWWLGSITMGKCHRGGRRTDKPLQEQALEMERLFVGHLL